MRVIHTVGSLSSRSGGPSITVPRLCEHLTKNIACNVISIVTSQGSDQSPNAKVAGVIVEEVTGGQYAKRLELLIAREQDRGATILHDHGQWLGINRASASVARRLGLPRVVSPRGMLSPWARNHRKYKKMAAWWLYARRDLAAASVIHATSDLEADELRALGVKQPIAVIPNGVDVTTAPEPDQFSTKPYVLFLSRIHPKKGVYELLRVWKSLPTTDWELVLAGYDEGSMLTGKTLPPNVRYVGHVEGEQKDRLFQRASLFVLPSFSENFGVVVAESLMAGVPVITTHGTPWESLIAEKCGWWIPMTEESLRGSLVEAMSMPTTELKQWGQRGRSFANRAFGWSEIAEKMDSVYRWILDGGSPPECVNLRS